jgi:hypothetical protein
MNQSFYAMPDACRRKRCGHLKIARLAGRAIVSAIHDNAIGGEQSSEHGRVTYVATNDLMSFRSIDSRWLAVPNQRTDFDFRKLRQHLNEPRAHEAAAAGHGDASNHTDFVKVRVIDR